jgi:hypothetical protein
MYVYTTTNPCLCNPGCVDCPPPCQDECNCLKLCHISINAYSDLAVGPCGATGTLNVMDPSYGHDTCACGDNNLYWSVEDYDKEMFITAKITPAGVLTWITQGPETLDKQYGCVVLKACCGQLSAYMQVLIGIKDLCLCPECGTCENCDPCTGICLDTLADVNLSSISSPSNTSINANS